MEVRGECQELVHNSPHTLFETGSLFSSEYARPAGHNFYITSHLAKECWDWRCVPLLAFCGFWALKLRYSRLEASTLLSESFFQSLVLMYSLNWFYSLLKQSLLCINYHKHIVLFSMQYLPFHSINFNNLPIFVFYLISLLVYLYEIY